MSIGAANLECDALGRSQSPSLVARARAYFASDPPRVVQTLLGLIWLLDGALQFQSFMYSRGFLQLLLAGAAGQPAWLADSIGWAVRLANGDLAVFNTLFALTQLALGAGLLYRRTVKPALAVSFAWALVVWWFGEAFGMLFMNMASPLTGAPGAVVVYALIGLIVWPGERPGGLLGVRGSRVSWAVLWGLMGSLWLLAANSSANATRTLIDTAPSGMGWLSSVQRWFATAAQGNGLVIALVLAFVSWAIAIAVAADWHCRGFLILAVGLNLAYWIVGQGFGGIFAGGATDPNAGPAFALLALALYWPGPNQPGSADPVVPTRATNPGAPGTAAGADHISAAETV
jgi:hypothetical protein